MTLHPETQVIASRNDGDAYVYTIRANGRDKDVRIPVATLAAIPKGAIGAMRRRTLLAQEAAKA